MKFEIYYLSCLVFIGVLNNAYSQCINSGAISSSRFTLPSSTARCREYTVGPLDNLRKNILVLFEGYSTNVACSNGNNVIIFNDARVKLLDYCQTRSTTYSSFSSIYVYVSAKHLIIQFLFSGSGALSATLDSFVIPSLSVTTAAQTTTPYQTASSGLPQTTTTPTARPLTGTTPTFTSQAVSSGSRSCGVPVYPMSQTGLRIVGGGEAAPHSHPWQVYVTDSRGRMTCGGSIIDNQWVITAAHCVDTIGGTYRVLLGAHNMSRIETTRRDVPISKVIVHETYDATGRLEDDIALLKLQTPIAYTNEILPICLPTKTPAAMTPSITTGWGLTRDGGFVSRVLNQVGISIRDNSFCRSVGISSSAQICAGNTLASNGLVKDSCQGDSGGPLITTETNKYVLNGIVSFGGSSCNGVGVYTNVASYINWIQTNMRAN